MEAEWASVSFSQMFRAVRDLLVTPTPSVRLADWFSFLSELRGILLLKKMDIRGAGDFGFHLASSGHVLTL